MNILAAISTIFAPWFKGETWKAWLAFLAALFALPVTDEQAETFKRHTGRTTLPTVPAREGWLAVGRRGGKSLVAALVAVFLACFRDYTGHLAPGEVATVMVIAADRRQARVIMRYVAGFLENVPMLSAMVVKRNMEGIELSNRVVIEVHTASFRAVRGYTLAAVICDEIAFWRSEESANPDTEILAALRPGLATIPGGLLMCISSPYARRGALWQAYQKHFGKDGDPVLVWQADTRSMNPTVDPAVIHQAYEEDLSSAQAEYGALFRSDIESYVDPESVARCVIPGRVELPPAQSLQYSAFVDVAGGSGQDSFTWGIAHLHGFVRPANYEDLPTRFKVAIQDEENKIRCEAKARGTVVVDLVREVKPPFSPEQAVEQCCADLARYRIREITGDKYAGSWPTEVFKKRGIRYCESPETKSQIYQNFLPLLNSGKLELPDDRRLVSQLCNLERRTSRAGRDSIDHAPGAHDDLCNAACGAALLVISSTRSGGSVQPITWVR